MTLLRGTDGQNGKAAPEKGVSWIGDLDLGYTLSQWVLEGGIQL